MRNFWSTNKRNDFLLLLQEQGRSLVHSLHSASYPCCVYSHKPINNKGVVN